MRTLGNQDATCWAGPTVPAVPYEEFENLVVSKAPYLAFYIEDLIASRRLRKK